MRSDTYKSRPIRYTRAVHPNRLQSHTKYIALLKWLPHSLHTLMLNAQPVNDLHLVTSWWQHYFKFDNARQVFTCGSSEKQIYDISDAFRHQETVNRGRRNCVVCHQCVNYWQSQAYCATFYWQKKVFHHPKLFQNFTCTALGFWYLFRPNRTIKNLQKQNFQIYKVHRVFTLSIK